MNWLERHLREFVFPCLKKYAEYNPAYEQPKYAPLWRRPEEYQSLTAEGITPVKGEIRPMKVANPSKYVGMLATVLKSYGLTEKLGSYLSNQVLRNRGFSIVSTRATRRFSQNVSDSEQLLTFLKANLRSIRTRLKGTDKQIVLLGRDVWLVSVLCERYGVPHVFDPRVSRTVARSPSMVNLLPEYCLREGDILFDTGFAGTIHTLVQEASGMNLECLMMSAGDRNKQVFPSMGLARNNVLTVEYLPKYFKSGTVIEDGRVVQYLANLDEFVEAAMGTIWAWEAESPKFIEMDRRPKP